ncbi:MAG: polysaccharide biosynthesis/export family protein, partial [Opitutaceae bacterium]
MFKTLLPLLLALLTVSASAAGPTTDPAYSLSPGDTISISVYNEPDLSVTQMLGPAGEVRVLLLGQINVGGKNIRAAEQTLEAAYRDRQFLKDPMVSVAVVSYKSREV